MVFLVVTLHVEIDVSFAFIGEAVGHDLLDHLLLLDDVAGRVRLDAGRQGVQLRHVFVVADGVFLHHFHGFQLLQLGFFGNFVFPLVRVVHQVAHVRDVAHVPHLVAQVAQIAEQQVECDCRPGVSQMGVPVHGGAAHVHPHERRVQRLKQFFFTA